MSPGIDDLEAEYCPPLDPALFSAIASDFDLDEEGSVRELRQTLDPLRLAAYQEERLDQPPETADGLSRETKDGGRREGSNSIEGDQTDLVASCSPASLDDQSSSSMDSAEDAMTVHGMRHEALDRASKLTLLKEMFPGVKEFTIAYTLKKADDNFVSTVEQLLNQVFLEEVDSSEEPLVKKGVDGFAVESSGGRARRRGHRKDRRIGRSLAESDWNRSSEVRRDSDWKSISDDVDYLASRLNLPRGTVASTYHRSGASIKSALQAILKDEEQHSSAVADVDALLEAQAIELKQDFPMISPADALHLTRLTRPSTAAAHELARHLQSSSDGKMTGRIEVLTRLPPIELDAPRPKGATPRSEASRPSYSEAIAMTTKYREASQAAFDQATAAYRRGKSDPLMASAAGYYSTLGRDHQSRATHFRSVAAEALVESQSSTCHLDLHGIGVKDAVRIAREHVTAWWVRAYEARQSGRSVDGHGHGYKIVTGIGRHSEGGRAKIGPAVGRMLVREGWRIAAGEGAIMVFGVADAR